MPIVVNKEGMSDNHDNRIDQLLRIDTNALLNTIRDLEYRLTEYQRQDKLPAWAQAWEARLEQIEKLQSSQSSSGTFDNRLSSPQRHGNQPKQLDESGKPFTLDELALEERILQMAREDMENKISNIHIHYDSILSGYSLEVDRLHKLLQIRPTNSEVQQILVNITTLEEQTNHKLHSIQHNLQANLSNRISDEMVILFEEMKNSRTNADEKHGLTEKQFQGVFQKVNEIRESAQQTIQQLEQVVTKQQMQIQELQASNEQKAVQLQQMIKNNANEIGNVKTAFINHENSMAEFKEIEAFKWQTSENKLKTEIGKIDKQLILMKELINTQENSVQDINADYATYKQSTKSEMAYLKNIFQEQVDKIAELEGVVKEVHSDMNEIRKLDIEDHFFRYNDTLNKVSHEIQDLQQFTQHHIMNEIKGINSKIKELNEAVTVTIPKQFQEENFKIASNTDRIERNYEQIDKLKRKLQITDDLISSTLISLPEKITNMMVKLTAQQEEILSIKRSMELNVDAHSEFIRRIEELEETIENLDDVINGRMNNIRDTLMEIFLEKQYETNQVMKNVKDNLEVIASAGDGPAAPPVMAKLQRVAQGNKANLFDEPGPVMAGPAKRNTTAPMPDLKKLNSFKIPTMDHTMITGLGGAPAANTSNTHNAHSNSPLAHQSGSTGSNNGGMANSDYNKMNYGGEEVAVASRSRSSGIANNSGNSKMPKLSELEDGLAPEVDSNGVQIPSARSTPRELVLSARGIPPVAEKGPASASHSNHSHPASTHGHANHQHPPLHGSSSQISGHHKPPDEHHHNNHHNNHHRSSPPPSAMIASESSLAEDSFGDIGSLGMGGGGAENMSLTSLRTPTSDIKAIVQEVPTGIPPQSHHQHGKHHQSHHAARSNSPPNVRGTPNRATVNVVLPNTNASISSVHPARQEMLSSEYASLIGMHDPSGGRQHPTSPSSSTRTKSTLNFEKMTNPAYFGTDNNDVQFLADLCINYEEISFRKKNIQHLPPVLCQHLLFITSQVAEQIANVSDFEMVAHMLMKVNGVIAMQDVVYDESYLLQRRDEKVSLILGSLQHLVNTQFQAAQGHQAGGMLSVPGLIRNEARQLFLSLVKKALEMFLTKHNQILVVGNSRLGRMKIPTCIACDRPMVEKSRLESAFGSPGRPNTTPGGLMENSVVSVRGIPNNPQVGGHNAWIQSSDGPLMLDNGEDSTLNFPDVSRGQRPRTGGNKTIAASSSAPYVMKAGFKMPTNSARPTSSHNKPLIMSSSTSSLPQMHSR